MKRALFIGVRLEACIAFKAIMGNYDYNVDIVTFKDSFIAKNKRVSAEDILLNDKGKALYRLWEIIGKRNYNVIFSAGLPYMLPEKFFSVKALYVNSHPHLLPFHKGADAIKKSFALKEKKYGVTVHYMTEAMDSGEIIAKREIVIEPQNIELIYNLLFSFIEPSAIIESMSLLKQRGAI